MTRTVFFKVARPKNNEFLTKESIPMDSNRISGKIIFDISDCVLISIIISIYLTEYLKSYFSEKQKMERLRQDLINKSKFFANKKIFNFAIRDGSEKLLYKNAKKIVDSSKKSNLILFYLVLLLTWKINVQYCVDPVTGQTMVIVMVVGGTLFANWLTLVFMSRSLVQQLIQNLDYKKYINFKEFQFRIAKLIEDKRH